MFISPDSIVPDPGSVFAYNRYLYTYGNPLKYSDPTGHDPWWIEDRTHSYVPASDHRELMSDYYDGNNGIIRIQPILPPLDSDSTNQNPLQEFAVYFIDTMLPPGASSIGTMASIGLGVDGVGSFGIIYLDEHGDVVVGGGSIGIGGNTGANADVGGYIQNFPTASSVDVFTGSTVNVGITVGEVAGVGGEINILRDPGTNQPIVGWLLGGYASAKMNIPLPPVEFYANVDFTEFTPLRFNIYDELGLPRP